MRISDWSSDVCSSDLPADNPTRALIAAGSHPDFRLLQRLPKDADKPRSEEHTSELQSLMRISYAVFCLKKKSRKSTLYNNTIIGLYNELDMHIKHLQNIMYFTI